MRCPACNAESAPGTAVCPACGLALGTAVQPAAGDALAPGTLLNSGRFTVGKVLGRGGFGVTYRGTIAATRESVAIKEFFPEGCQRRGNTLVPTRIDAREFQDYIAKFLEEADTLSRFDHPGIVKVIDSFGENGTAYLVMEFLEGRTLKQKLDAEGRMTEAEAVACIRDVAAALNAIHAKNMLHRDVKPDNIMLAADGRVVLIDFGTAREFATGQTKTMTRMVTPGYAPLEQRSAHGKFGPFTDVYALGATLYHMLTGQVPTDALDRIQGVDIKHPRRIHGDISAEVSAAVMEAMRVRTTLRTQTIPDFLRSLKQERVRQRIAKSIPLGQDSMDTEVSQDSDHGVAVPDQSNAKRQPETASQPRETEIPLPWPISFTGAVEDRSASRAARPARRADRSSHQIGQESEFDWLTFISSQGIFRCWELPVAASIAIILVVLYIGVPQMAARIYDQSDGTLVLSPFTRNLIVLSDWMVENLQLVGCCIVIGIAVRLYLAISVYRSKLQAYGSAPRHGDFSVDYKTSSVVTYLFCSCFYIGLFICILLVAFSPEWGPGRVQLVILLIAIGAVAFYANRISR